MKTRTLWGFDGDIKGNEGFLVAQLPVVVLPSGQIAGLCKLADNSGGDCEIWEPFHNEEDARDHVTQLQLSEDVVIASHQFVVILGSTLRSQLEKHQVSLGEGWAEAQNGCLIKPLTAGEYSQLKAEWQSFV